MSNTFIKKVTRPAFILMFLAIHFLVGSNFVYAEEPEVSDSASISDEATADKEATSEPEKTYYFLTDHLGSVDTVLDEEGNIVEQRDYLPYGKENTHIQEADESQRNSYGFTGKELDEETDLYYYGARYYDPLIGRFMSVDPWEGDLTDPQTLNKYSYARNNPLRYIDPTGEKLLEFQRYKSKKTEFISGEYFGNYRGINIISRGTEKVEDTKFQCVELVTRYMKNIFGVKLDGTGNGVDYGNQAELDRALKDNNSPGSMTVHNNGSTVMPREDDIFSWTGGTWGHVGIIAEVNFDKKTGTGTVWTLEQNYLRGSGLYSQNLTRSYNEDGKPIYTVADRNGTYKTQSWARYSKPGLLFKVFDFFRDSTKEPTKMKPVKDQPDKN